MCFKINYLVDVLIFSLNATNLNQRHQTKAKTLHPSTTCWLQTTKTRLIAGMGNASVYENGITLHHLYGIPYLPASSIKGLLRSWILQCCFNTEKMENNHQLEQAAMKDPLFIRLFGGIYKKNKEIHKEEAKRGDLIVWDAFPTKKPKVEVDIITNHYKYEENAKHGQAKKKLNLVKFLTVAAGVPFQWLLSEWQPTREVLKTNSPIWTSKNLGEYTGILEEHGFKRVHRSHLINPAFVSKFI